MITIQPCTLRDLADIYEIIGTYKGKSDNLFISIRNSIIQRYNYFLMEDCCMLYEPMGLGKYQVHIYSLSRDKRGTQLKDFAIGTGRWMLDNTDAKVFFNFVEDNRLDLKIFMRMIGSKKIGLIPGTSEILYVSTDAMGIERSR